MYECDCWTCTEDRRAKKETAVVTKPKKADKVLPLRSAYAEAKKTIEKLEEALRERTDQLLHKDTAIQVLREQRDEQARRSDEKTRLYQQRIDQVNIDHANALKALKSRAEAPFTRGALDGMTLIQIRTLAEEAINECRRRDMVEAEGLAQKHRKFADTTDLETLTNLERTYHEQAERARQVLAAEQERARKAAAVQTPLYTALAPMATRSWSGRRENVPVCHCGLTLTRGQCPEHTQRWTGSERCVCGRAFFFCKDEFNAGHNHNGHKPTMVPEAELPRDSRH